MLRQCGKVSRPVAYSVATASMGVGGHAKYSQVLRNMKWRRASKIQPRYLSLAIKLRCAVVRAASHPGAAYNIDNANETITLI